MGVTHAQMDNEQFTVIQVIRLAPSSRAKMILIFHLIWHIYGYINLAQWSFGDNKDAICYKMPIIQQSKRSHGH